MAEAIGLFGGSFDPIHHGHLIVARAIFEQLGLERMIFLPSASPPHKEAHDLTEAAHRAEMLQLAIEDEPGFAFSDFDLSRGGPTYTIDTIAHFRAQAGGGVELCWIIGADSLTELPSWHRVSALVDECRIITAARPGWTGVDWDKLTDVLRDDQIARLCHGVLETPLLEISSTDIRRRVFEGRSIRYLVPERVRDYIESHRLYRNPTTGSTTEPVCRRPRPPEDNASA